ncbi:alpha/beta hydrolase family protein [Lysobacter fragariae]
MSPHHRFSSHRLSFRRAGRLLVLALAGVSAFSALAATPAGFRGKSYEGLIDAAGELSQARVSFEPVGEAWRAQVQIAGHGEVLPASVAFAGVQLTLELPGPNGPMRCTGVVDDVAIVAPTGAAGCRLELVSADDGPLARQLGGAWRDAQGNIYAIARSGDSPASMWIDYQSGAWRGLVERDGALHMGPSAATPWPEQYALVPDGEALWLRPAGTRRGGTRLLRIALREQPLQWTTGEATIKGTLILPEQGQGARASKKRVASVQAASHVASKHVASKHATPKDGDRIPAVILTHMSSPGTREGYRQFAYFFAAHGIATLIYDRRGSGESSGDEASAGMHRLADDGVAAAQVLATLPQIDPARIGTWGHSQGGWIAPLAAARSPQVAFVIAQSASGVAPAKQELFRVEHNARDAGLDVDEVNAAIDYERRLMDWVRTGAGRDDIHALAKANASARWARFVELRDDLPAKPSARSQSFWWFDPVPDLTKVRVPTLVIHGDRDGYVPVDASLPILRQALAGTDAHFVLLPRAVHGLWVGDRDSSNEAMRSPGFHPDYWPQLLGWLRKQSLAP